MKIIPAIDLRGGRPVRLVQGREDKVTVYEGNPVQVALGYESAGATLIHVVDLDAAFRDEGADNRAVISDIIAAVHCDVEVGGGIRTLEAIEFLVEHCRARYVVVGTMAVEHPDWLARAVREYGDQVVVGIDARGPEVATRGWTRSSGRDATGLAADVVQAGVGRIIYTDIARDGKMEGPNLVMTRAIAVRSGAKVTASGGISCLDDLRRLAALEADGVEACIIGKALYEERFTLAEAIAAAAGPA